MIPNTTRAMTRNNANQNALATTIGMLAAVIHANGQTWEYTQQFIADHATGHLPSFRNVALVSYRQTYKRIANTIAAPYVNINTQNGNLFGCQSPISEMVRDHRWRWTVAHLHQFRAGARFLAWYANGEPYPAIVTLDEATSHNQEPEQPFLLVILRGLANMTFGWQYGRFVHVA